MTGDGACYLTLSEWWKRTEPAIGSYLKIS